MNMISQPVLSSSTTGHGLSISDNFTTPIVSQPTLLNTVGLHDVNYEYLPYIFNSFLNPNNQHHHQNDCNNTPLNHQLIPNNSDILNLNALQIPIFKMIIANRNNKMNDSIINNNPMINMTHKNSENNSSFTNFSLTSSLTRAISSNTNSIGSQILPICTPLLQLAIRHALAEYILESYKKQLAAFNQIQAVWKMSTSSNSEKISNSSLKFDPKIKYSDNSNDKQKPNSEPNTPAKIGRRTRTNIGQTGRLTSIRRQSTNRRFPCNQCKEEFPSLHTLEQHTLSQHGTYRCHICQAQFTQRSNLQRHALKHVGFKPFECRVCSKAYYRKDHLMRHMEMGHPGFTPRDNITVHLTSSESLDYLTRSNSLVEFQSIPENYEQQEQQQQPMFTDETIIENEYYNDNEHENLDDTNLSPSPINKSHNVDSVYSPIKDEISLSLSEEQIKDSTQTTQ
ncbi:putative zinc finger protein [Schistosoma mansoni]|uniref:putative zinc finger protein n=1 Tax=Schistosoma mansoni TaxID=6183 RepID=UPI0001A641E6|nr:putative zinc finger protein [Schistosoma mansoni]|eukprot:XP_018651971.1 putative zinc finger protein [Schistosoma mansoni]